MVTEHHVEVDLRYVRLNKSMDMGAQYWWVSVWNCGTQAKGARRLLWTSREATPALADFLGYGIVSLKKVADMGVMPPQKG